jgi:hypothetical protein
MTPHEYEMLRNLEKKNDALEAQIKQLKDEAEAWAKEELVIMDSKREHFRTMYCDNCENFKSDKCSGCFSNGYTHPSRYSPAPHFLFKEPHPKDAEIARMKNCGNCAFGWEGYEGEFTCYPKDTDINWRMCSEDKSYRHWKFGKAVNAE